MKRALIPAIILCFSFTLPACGNNDSNNHHAANANSSELSPAAPSSETANNDKAREVFPVKIRINIGNLELTATMFDNETSRDFLSMLPLTLSLKDYAGTEKISDLPKRLATKGAPSGSDPSVGDITYYAPWGNLAIFYRDFGYAEGLIILGKFDSGVDKLSQLNGKATFARME